MKPQEFEIRTVWEKEPYWNGIVVGYAFLIVPWIVSLILRNFSFSIGLLTGICTCIGICMILLSSGRGKRLIGGKIQ